MELWQEILSQKGIKCDCYRVIESESYITLRKIKEIIEDTELEDKECFEKIEDIVRAFEKIGSNGGARHDFG